MQSITHSDDFELLRAWRAGDERAGERLTRRHYARVHRFFSIKVTDSAEDLTQRTFLACLEGLERFRGNAGFKAYLFGIARKQLLRHLHERSQRAAVAQFESDSSVPKTSVSTVVARRQEHHILLLAMARLSADQRIATELFYWEGMRTPEIAAVLEIPLSTVTTRLARARDTLKLQIREIVGPGRLHDELVANLETWTRSLGTGRDAKLDGGPC